MSCMPRIRLVLVALVLLTLLAVPMAGARTVGSASIRPAASDWVGGVLSWAQNLLGVRHAGHHGRSGNQVPLTPEGWNAAAGQPSGRRMHHSGWAPETAL